MRFCQVILTSVLNFCILTLSNIFPVHGYATHEGRFTITLEETDVAISETCESALAIDADGVSTLGSTENVLSSTAALCGVVSDNGPGVWYMIAGSGRSMTASTCLSSDDVLTIVTVFSGECNVLGCVEAVEGPCDTHHSVTWITEAGVEYFLLVQSQDPLGVGSPFVFYVEETTGNDLCENAIGPIGADGSPTFGSTRSATADPLASTSRSVWYSVLGTGAPLMVSTCSEFTNFPTSLSVYQGTDGCDTFSFVETTASPGNCAFGSIQSWISVQDEVYYVLVAGALAENFGNFALSIATVPS
jgi:hypothetical protein